jgi:hypothetical protein
LAGLAPPGIVLEGGWRVVFWFIDVSAARLLLLRRKVLLLRRRVILWFKDSLLKSF